MVPKSGLQSRDLFLARFMFKSCLLLLKPYPLAFQGTWRQAFEFETKCNLMRGTLDAAHEFYVGELSYYARVIICFRIVFKY